LTTLAIWPLLSPIWNSPVWSTVPLLSSAAVPPSCSSRIWVVPDRVSVPGPLTATLAPLPSVKKAGPERVRMLPPRLSAVLVLKV
jgi:hypothetical protein